MKTACPFRGKYLQKVLMILLTYLVCNFAVAIADSASLKLFPAFNLLLGLLLLIMMIMSSFLSSSSFIGQSEFSGFNRKIDSNFTML